MDYYFEFEGGLGDIFFRMFAESEYRKIEEFLPEDRARITLITVNPFSDEIFKWHPKLQQLDIRILPHWWPDEDQKMRTEYGLPPKVARTRVSHTIDTVKFYPSPSDFYIIDKLKDSEYFILAAAAGGESRIFPSHIVSHISSEASRLGITLVAVGRNYPEQRGGSRYEPKMPQNDFTIDLVDQLSVPGVAKLVEGASGVLCSHSAINLLAWFLNKPVLLLYPQHVYDQYIVKGQPSGYTMGLNRSNTRHALFKECSPGLIREFLLMARAAAPSRHAQRPNTDICG